nr:restriction endonuclease subunit S [uncultured Desulfobulbus sp.]
MTKLFFVAEKIGDGLHSTPNYVDSSDYYFVNGNNLENGKIVIRNTTKCVDEVEYNKYKININDRTILLSINGTIGKIAFYNDENVILGKSAAYIVCTKKLSKNYLFYLLQSNAITNYFTDEVTGTGTTIQNLSLHSIKNTPVLLPPLNAQKNIASYLDNILTKHDFLIDKTNHAVNLLQERRTALISAAVTGKIDVRNAYYRR